MKKSILLLLPLLAASASGQRYGVSGLAPEGATTVYLRNLEAARGAEPDSVVVGADRLFSFSGDAAGRLFAELYTNRAGADAIPLVLDGELTASFDTRTAAGTAENAALSAANAQLDGFRQEMQRVGMEYQALQQSGQLNEDLARGLEARYDKADSALAAAVRNLCETNQQALFPAYLLRSSFYSIPRADIIRWADSGAAFFGTSLLARLKASTAGWKRQLPGVMFTDLEEADTAGVTHKLSEYVGQGKVVLIDFWASWCRPCMMEMPNVKALYEKYRDKGFAVVGLSFDRDAKAWKGAIRRNGLDWTHLSDLKFWDTEAAKVYGINSIPSTLLVDAQGKVIAANLRGDELAEKLRELFD